MFEENLVVLTHFRERFSTATQHLPSSDMYHLYNLGFHWWTKMFLFRGFNAVSLQSWALTSCLSGIWQTLPTGSLAGSSSLTQPLKGEENVVCSVQEQFVAEEGLRTATPGGESSLPFLLFW